VERAYPGRTRASSDGRTLTAEPQAGSAIVFTVEDGAVRHYRAGSLSETELGAACR
jgi:hypothetical protein